VTALQQAQTDEQQVQTDQQLVSKDETTLAKALTTASSSTSTSSGGQATTAAAGSGTSTGSGTTQKSAVTSATATSSAEQIDSDEAAIDMAEATLINAQQSLSAAQLTSPLAGTVASVGLTVGDTVSANSSTETIEIISTSSYEVTGTLTSTQVTAVKVGYPATVSVDGGAGHVAGTVSQVGPVQASTTGYSYPVVVALPAAAKGMFSGSTAAVSIRTGGVSNVAALPTSAILTGTARSYVLVLSASGALTEKKVKTGLVGDVYTQVLSGVKVGQSVVLANLSEAVPSSNTATVGGFGGGAGGFGGGAGGFGGAGGGQFSRTAVGGGFRAG
jgi:RND family efflux transporter MFP subunit